MKTLMFFLLLFPSIAYGQVPDSSLLAASRKKALQDISRKQMNFYIRGGIASVYYAGQEIFEKKYKVNYFDTGCIAPMDLDIETYNQIISKHLDQQYGKTWRKEVRKDISGIK